MPDIAWTERQEAAQSSWYDVAWSPTLGVLVAVANADHQVMTSPDGVTWTQHVLATNLHLQGICWSPTLALFVGVGYYNSLARIATSPDGVVWTERTAAVAVGTYLQSVCWSAALHLFVAVGGGTSAAIIQTSPDGITWTARTSADDTDLLYNVIWVSRLNRFIACSWPTAGNVGFQIQTSANGVTWTSRATPAGNNQKWFSLADSPELEMVMCVGGNGTGTGNRTMHSPDGLTWTEGGAPAFASGDGCWNRVAWSPALRCFALVGEPNGFTSASGDVSPLATSTDGINLTVTLGAHHQRWFGLVWVPELSMFVAVANYAVSSGSSLGAFGWVNNARPGPFNSGIAGTFYVALLDQANRDTVQIQKTTNYGLTFALVGTLDVLNLLASYDVEFAGSTLHIAVQERVTGRVSYHAFSILTDTWTIVNEQIIASVTSADLVAFGCVAICQRSVTNEQVIVYLSDSITVTATAYRRADYVRRTGVATYTSPAALCPSPATNAAHVVPSRAIAGALDRVHMFYRPLAALHADSGASVRTLPSTNVLGAQYAWFASGISFLPAGFLVGDGCAYNDGVAKLAVPFKATFGEPYLANFTDADDLSGHLIGVDVLNTDIVWQSLGTYFANSPQMTVRYLAGELHALWGLHVGALNPSWMAYSHGVAGAMSTQVQASPYYPTSAIVPQGYSGMVLLIDGALYIGHLMYAEGLTAPLPFFGVLFALVNVASDLPVPTSFTITDWIARPFGMAHADGSERQVMTGVYVESFRSTLLLNFDLGAITRGEAAGGWFWDRYNPAAVFHYGEEGPGVHSLLVGGDDTNTGKLYQYTGNLDGETEVSCEVQTPARDQGSLRDHKLYGDVAVDAETQGAQMSCVVGLNNNQTLSAPTAFNSVSRVLRAIPTGPRWTTARNISAQFRFNVKADGNRVKLYFWEARYTFSSAPLSAFSWEISHSSFGLPNYKHAGTIRLTHVSWSDLRLIFTIDGIVQPMLTIPHSDGHYRTDVFRVPVMKGKLWKLRLSSVLEFRLDSRDSFFQIKEWGSEAPYQEMRLFGDYALVEG